MGRGTNHIGASKGHHTIVRCITRTSTAHQTLMYMYSQSQQQLHPVNYTIPHEAPAHVSQSSNNNIQYNFPIIRQNTMNSRNNFISVSQENESNFTLTAYFFPKLLFFFFKSEKHLTSVNESSSTSHEGLNITWETCHYLFKFFDPELKLVQSFLLDKCSSDCGRKPVLEDLLLK